MIVVRNVIQAKYGRGDELVQLMKEFFEVWPSGQNSRVMTDLSGTFFTVVTETDFESLAAWEALAGPIFADPRFAGWFERMVPLVESGRRELFTLA